MQLSTLQNHLVLEVLLAIFDYFGELEPAFAAHRGMEREFVGFFLQTTIEKSNQYQGTKRAGSGT